jgi:hypothetical protein
MNKAESTRCYLNYLDKNRGWFNSTTFKPQCIINGKVVNLLTIEEFELTNKEYEQ